VTSSPAVVVARDSGAQAIVHLAVGRLSPNVGGPYQTVMAYRGVLQQSHDTRLIAIRDDQERRPLDTDSDTYLIPGWRGWSKLVAYSWRARSDDVLVFGVWHRVFFVASLVRLLSGARGAGRRTLVPTQSLSAWDWAKHRRIKSLLRPFVNVALRQFDMVIFATEGERETSVPTLPRDKTTVIYHPIAPIDTAAAHRRAVLGSPRVVFVGRLDPQKDLRLFINTVALLPSSWSADVVGRGDDAYRALLMQDADRLGCSDRVRWHGWLSRSETHSVLAGANALLITSHAENYSHAAVEAMALRVPVVMVDRVAAATDIRRNKTGIVVAANPQSLAAAITDLPCGAGTSLQTLIDRASEFALARESGADTAQLVMAVTGAPS
jgi:glycosyltransferase involved in cell wall biosynthesis